jgi:dUTP pyrophosphatase
MNETPKLMDRAPGKPVVKFKKLEPTAVIPTFAKDGDAGLDLTATWFEKKDFTIIAHTGISMELPPGYEAQVRCRSGLAVKGVTIVNSPGTIDQGYRGEIMVIIGSVSGIAPSIYGTRYEANCASTSLRAGDRIAQLVISKLDPFKIEEVEDLDESTERGAGGMGSTGA